MLNTFKARFGQPLDSNRFDCVISPPKCMFNEFGGLATGAKVAGQNGAGTFFYTDANMARANEFFFALPVLAKSLQLPGAGVNSEDVDLGMGFTRHSPYEGSAAAPIEITFYVAGEGAFQTQVLDFFQEWQHRIYRNQQSPSDPWAIGYYDHFVTDIQIRVFRRDGAPVMIYRLEEAWPATVSAIRLDWDGQQSQPMTLSVTFNYHEWNRKAIQLPPGAVEPPTYLVDTDMEQAPEFNPNSNTLKS